MGTELAPRARALPAFSTVSLAPSAMPSIYQELSNCLLWKARVQSGTRNHIGKVTRKHFILKKMLHFSEKWLTTKRAKEDLQQMLGAVAPLSERAPKGVKFLEKHKLTPKALTGPHRRENC